MADFIFPDFDGLDETNLAPEIDESGSVFEPLINEEQPYGLTWRFDFTEGDIALSLGKKPIEVIEHETLREWLTHTLLTARGETSIFSDEIGTDIYNMIGETTILDATTISRIEKQIADAIRVHDRIESVNLIVIIPLVFELYVYMSYTTTDSAEFNDLIAL